MSHELNKEEVPEEIKKLLEAIQETLRNHHGTLAGVFSVSIGEGENEEDRTCLYDLSTVSGDTLEVWG